MKIKVTDTVFHSDVRIIASQFSYEDERGTSRKRIPTDTNIDANASADKVAEILRLGYEELVRRVVPSAEIDITVTTVADKDGANLFNAPIVQLKDGGSADVEENIDITLKLRDALQGVKKSVFSVVAIDKWQVLKTTTQPEL